MNYNSCIYSRSHHLNRKHHRTFPGPLRSSSPSVSPPVCPGPPATRDLLLIHEENFLFSISGICVLGLVSFILSSCFLLHPYCLYTGISLLQMTAVLCCSFYYCQPEQSSCGYTGVFVHSPIGMFPVWAYYE